jgi:uncharacterized cupin superfamily protein
MTACAVRAIVMCNGPLHVFPCEGAGDVLAHYTTQHGKFRRRSAGVRTVKIELSAVPRRKGTDYPQPFDAPCRERVRQALGDAAGLSDFGVNLLQLPPGAWSSQRHWHSAEDEFTWVLQGEVVLITDDGEEVLRAGDCAGFKAGVANGHHLQNRSNAPATVLEIGSRRADEDVCSYSDIDMQWGPAGIMHKDGTPY